MTAEEFNKRREDRYMEVLATKIEVMAKHMERMESGITKMTSALTQLAIMEERQTHTIMAQERAFKALERVEERQREHEARCVAQEKELREGFAAAAKIISDRVAELEKAEPMQAQTSKWVTAALWGTIATLGAFIVPRILERLFS